MQSEGGWAGEGRARPAFHTPGQRTTATATDNAPLRPQPTAPPRLLPEPSGLLAPSHAARAIRLKASHHPKLPRAPDTVLCGQRQGAGGAVTQGLHHATGIFGSLDLQ